MRALKKIVIIMLIFMASGYNAEAFFIKTEADLLRINKIVCGYDGGDINPSKDINEQLRKYDAYSYTAEDKADIKYLIFFLSTFDVSDWDSQKFSTNIFGYRIRIYYNKEADTDPMVITYSSSQNGYRTGAFFHESITYDQIDNEKFVKFHDYALADDCLDKFMEKIRAIHNGDIIIDENSLSQEKSLWAKEDVEVAIEKKLVSPWNQMNYQGKINRLETCQIMANYLIINGYTMDKWFYNTISSDPEKLNGYLISYKPSPFSDINDMSVNCLYGCEIANGKEGKNFYPYDNLTREEFAKILSKAYHFIHKDVIAIEAENMYADSAKISEWAKPYVSEMTELGILQGEDNGYFNPKGEITKEQVIVALLRLYNLDKGT